MQKYCACCGFDLEECYGCGFTRDPDEDWECPNCGADLPNTRAPQCIEIQYQPSIPSEPTMEELLAAFPSL